MPAESYPELDLGKETGVNPTKLRAASRPITIVGGIVDAEKAYFDNGLLAGKAKVEQGIAFGPEVLRAMGGRRVLALWLAAAKDETGKPGWIGLTVGEMRIHDQKKEGYRDVSAFQTKLTDASKGRVAIWQMKEGERKALLGLLQQKPELWIHASKGFRDTVMSSVPEATQIGAGAGDAPADQVGAPKVDLGVDTGFPASTLRSGGRDVSLVGMVVEGATATWDNGLLSGKSKAEQGITFGAEPMRAQSGKRVCGLYIAVARNEEGKPGWFGLSCADMRIDAVKKEGFKDLAAQAMKVNDAARGRVELWRLKPEEKQAVVKLLQGKADFWEAAFETVRSAFE
jgi:hypothetical protein